MELLEGGGVKEEIIILDLDMISNVIIAKIKVICKKIVAYMFLH